MILFQAIASGPLETLDRDEVYALVRQTENFLNEVESFFEGMPEE